MNAKPGFVTSEFWATLITHIVAIIALVHPGFSVGQWVQPAAVLAAGLATAVYGLTRAGVKTTATKMSAISGAGAAVGGAPPGGVGSAGTTSSGAPSATVNLR